MYVIKTEARQHLIWFYILTAISVQLPCHPHQSSTHIQPRVDMPIRIDVILMPLSTTPNTNLPTSQRISILSRGALPRKIRIDYGGLLGPVTHGKKSPPFSHLSIATRCSGV